MAFVCAHDLEAGFHPVEREIDRFLAEDRLARPRETLDQVGMRIGRCADHDRVDVCGGLDLVYGADRAAVLVGDGPGGVGEGIGHGNKPCICVARDSLGMYLADAPRAQKSEPDSHDVLVFGPVARG